MIIKLPYSEIGYKLKMIEKNEIPGLLKLKYTVIDGEIYMKYNISSKIAIRDLYSRKKINSSQIKMLLQGIIEIVDKIENYLLDTNNIILTNDMIFADVDRGKIYLCYNPDYKYDFFSSFRKLIQELLSEVDYNDSTAIELIYKVNEWCSSESNDINELKDIVKKELDIFTYSNNDICSNHLNFVEDSLDTGQNRSEYNYSIPKKENFIEYFWRSLKNRFGRFKKEIKEGIEPYDDCYINKGYSDRNNIMTKEITDHGSNSDNETVLVSEALLNRKRCLISMCESGNISIESYPFIIGKLEKNVDGVIKHSSISRIQAKINCSDNQYFLEDLNSKNGTYVNEERIAPYEIVEIKIGDKIGFAEMDFIFR